MRAGFLLMMALTACATTPAADPTFVAQNSDFQDFQTWPHWQIDATSLGAFHTTGPRIVYLNRKPQSDATTWPVGTILVKTLQNGSGDTFAMVKRGGDFNADWARGWEWMELSGDVTGTTPGTWQIAWRGNDPPPGGGYTEDGVSCNLCHAMARANDWVQSAALKLPLK